MKALAVDLGGSHAACAVVADREVLAVETVSLEGCIRPRASAPGDGPGAAAGGLDRGRSRVGLRRPRLRLLRPGGHRGGPGSLDQRQVRGRAGAGPAGVVPAVVRPAVPDRERRAHGTPRRAPRRGRPRHGRRGDDDPRDRHRRRGPDRGTAPPREALPGRGPRRTPRGRFRGPGLQLRREGLRGGGVLQLGPARGLPCDARLRRQRARPARTARLRGALRLRRARATPWLSWCATDACGCGRRERWR